MTRTNRLKQNKISNNNFNFSFKQLMVHFEYLWFILNELTYFYSSYPTFSKQVRFRKQLYSLEIQIKSLPCFIELHKLYYTSDGI